VDRTDDRTALNRIQSSQETAYVTHIDCDALYEWQTDAWGRFEWAKIVEEIVEQASPEESPIYYWRCRIWYRDSWAVYGMLQDGDDAPLLLGEGLNKLGEVPLVLLTFDDALDRNLFGWTPADELAQIARDDFQGMSRHDELLRKQGFAILEVPIREGEEKKVHTMDIGAARAHGTPQESSRGMAYVAPPDGPVASHERKHAADGNEALRAMGLEQILSSTAAPASALERQYEFQTTNAALADYGHRAARYERDVHRLVMLFDGKSAEQADEAVDALKSEWPDDFDIRDRQADVTILQAVTEIPGMDPYSLTAAVRQVRDATLQMSDEDKKKSDKWLDEQLKTMLAPPPPPKPPEPPTPPQDGQPPAEGQPEDETNPSGPGAANFDKGKQPAEQPIPQ
jgi:hypothetical protein